MKVSLLTHTPNPEKIVAAAARLCYSDKEVSEIMNNFTEEKIDKFINKLIDLGHESPLEHVSFTFGIEGISRACSHQLVRHRIASYSQKSQRYVDESGFSYVFPQSIIDAGMERIYESLMFEIDLWKSRNKNCGWLPPGAFSSVWNQSVTQARLLGPTFRISSYF